MTRHRGYKERPSKLGVVDELVEQIIEEVESPKVFGEVATFKLLIREQPGASRVIDVLHQGERVEILDKVDSKWVQVTTPCGLRGYCGLDYIKEDANVTS